MKSVNVLPTFVSQEADLKDNGTTSPSAGKSKDQGFSRLVDQHVSAEKETQLDKKEREKTNPDAAIASHKSKRGGNVDNESHRQENDSSKAEHYNNADNQRNSKLAVDQDKALLSSDKEQIAQSDLPEQLSENQSGANEALEESEQFISLLYSSDNTLQKELNSELDKELINKEAQIGNSPENSSEKVLTVNGADEHRLKSFSKEDLAARIASKNETLMEQPSAKVLKDYQASLQANINNGNTNNSNVTSELTSEQLIKNQLNDTDFKNNKISAVVSGSTSSEQSKLNESLEEDLSVDELALLDKSSANKKQNSTLADSNSLSRLLSQQDSTKVNAKFSETLSTDTDKKLSSQSNTELTEAVTSESEIELLSKGEAETKNKLNTGEVNPSLKANGDNKYSKVEQEKLLAEQKVQSALATGNSANEELDKSIDTTSTQSVSVQASQHQKAELKSELKSEIKVELKAEQKQEMKQELKQELRDQAISNDNQLSDEAVDFFADDQLFSADKLKQSVVQATTSLTGAASLRSAADLQYQSIQTTQTQQNNDAYMEYQSSEMLNHTVASDTAQIQKNNVLLQQETISIFRKDFAEAVKDKVTVMINQKLQQFDISLDPPEFGNMQVRVNLQGEQAAVNFVVQNQQAKEALEENMHKLKEMLSEQGVDVGGANVEQQNHQENGDGSGSMQNTNNGSLLSSQNDNEHNVTHTLSSTLFDNTETGVDYYV